MSALKRKVGDALHLRLALSDGATNKYVRAKVYDETNSLLSTIVLPHLYQGVYGENTEVMPQKDQLIARFEVFKDPALTVIDRKYTMAMDTYDLDIGRVLISNQTLDAELAALELEGSGIESSILDAEQYASELESNFSSNEPTGDVISNQSDSELGTQQLNGEISSC